MVFEAPASSSSRMQSLKARASRRPSMSASRSEAPSSSTAMPALRVTRNATVSAMRSPGKSRSTKSLTTSSSRTWQRRPLPGTATKRRSGPESGMTA